MNILEQIEAIAREAWEKSEAGCCGWEKSEPGELERREQNRLVHIVGCSAEKLALEARWHEDCFYFADSGSPIFSVTISGLNQALVWLQQEQQRRGIEVHCRASREERSVLTPAEERRLAFVRWLVTTGRLTEQVAWSVLEEA